MIRAWPCFIAACLSVISICYAQDPVDLSASQREFILQMAGDPADFDLFYRLWLFGRVPPPKGEDLQRLQRDLFNVPNWDSRLWRRVNQIAAEAQLPKQQLKSLQETIVEAAEKSRRLDGLGNYAGAAEAMKDRERAERRIADAAAASVRLSVILERMGRVKSLEMVPLLGPLLESETDSFSVGDVVYTSAASLAAKGLNRILSGNPASKVEIPYSGTGTVDDWRIWWKKHKSDYAPGE